MKEGIHPEYHEINIVMTDGYKYATRSCWGKPGDVMNLDIDPKNHPAWHGGAQKVIEKAQLSKFEKRFGTFLSGDAAATAPSSAPAAAPKDASAPAAAKDAPKAEAQKVVSAKDKKKK
jgi:large subunit ribosomal protein L31